MKDSKVRYGQSSLKAPTIWLLRGGGGYGWFGFGKNFFLAYNGARFIFSVLYNLKDIFSPGTSMQEFFSLEISLQDVFSWNHPYPLKKKK